MDLRLISAAAAALVLATAPALAKDHHDRHGHHHGEHRAAASHAAPHASEHANHAGYRRHAWHGPSTASPAEMYREPSRNRRSASHVDYQGGNHGEHQGDHHGDHHTDHHADHHADHNREHRGYYSGAGEHHGYYGRTGEHYGFESRMHEHDHHLNFHRHNVYARHHHHFHGGNWYWPHGYRHRRLSFGMFLPSIFFGSDYWISDYYDYDLPPPPPGAVWVRYDNDAVLVDRFTGEVLEVVYGEFY